MNIEECDKKLVPLSVKDLKKYERTPVGEVSKWPPGPLVPTETNIKNIKLVECNDSHIGTKIVASHVTVHLPEEKTISIRSRKWLLTALAVAAISVAIILAVLFTLPSTSPPQDDIIDGGDHPADWYYTRGDRNASECDEPSPRILRDNLVVDSLDKTCVKAFDCLQLIQTFGEGTDFYIAAGRVYEGYGWNCQPRKRLRVVFLSKGNANQLDMYAFNALANMGVEMHEIESIYEVFPACCAESTSQGPSRGTLIFLETLPKFKRRECIAQNKNCQQDN